MKKPDISIIPTNSGVYQYINNIGKTIYVGKAKNLKNRISSYWSNQQRLPLRILNMLDEAFEIKWTIVQSEIEALNLEWSLIKEFTPKYNIDFNFDDSSYTKLAFTTNEDFPRVFLTRKTIVKNTKYLGPFPKSWAIKNSVDYLRKIYPIRTCTSSVFKTANRTNRSCLLGDIKKCSAPCTEQISKEDYNKLLTSFLSVFKGSIGPLIKNLENEMLALSDKQEFEKAAKIRDNIESFKIINEKNSVVGAINDNVDYICLIVDEVESSYCHLIVRQGTIKAEISSIVEKTENLETGQIFEYLLLKIFENYPDYNYPKVVYTNIDVSKGFEEYLNNLIDSKSLSSTKFQTPLRGQKKALLNIAIENANEKLRLEKMKHATSLDARTKGLNEIAQYLELPKAPFRIEGYDISHTQGENQVASMVVFEDGKPNKKEYRKFTIKDALGDVPSLKETIHRRFTNDSNKFQNYPNLLIIDGAKPQADGVKEVLDTLGINIKVIGLAKRLEEVWTTESKYPIIFSRGSKALYILQQVRDESHRFAISFHRKLRSKKSLLS